MRPVISREPRQSAYASHLRDYIYQNFKGRFVVSAVLETVEEVLEERSDVSSDSFQRAFVFDDEAAVGRIVSNMLAKSVPSVQQFNHLSRFLEGVQDRPPDLVVLDLGLGDTDAVEVVRKLGGLNYQGSVLLMSGKNAAVLNEVQEVALMHGLSVLPPLQKPFRANDVQERLSSPPVRQAANDGLSRRVDPATALANDHFQLWYQPKIDLRSNRVAGAEALLRVRHPRYGVLGPDSFLPASDDPLHLPIFEFVLRQALRDWRILADQGIHLRLSVNVTLGVLYSKYLGSLMRRMLPKDDPDFPGLLLEITEDDIIHDPLRAREVATQLKLYNVLLSIDDFGARAASLSRLRDLPFYELKLDKQFVHGCADDDNNRIVCEAAVKLGHQFRTVVCAEGVEDVRDLAQLRRLGFDHAQGYLFARPKPLAEFMLNLMARRGLEPNLSSLAPASVA